MSIYRSSVRGSPRRPSDFWTPFSFSLKNLEVFSSREGLHRVHPSGNPLTNIARARCLRTSEKVPSVPHTPALQGQWKNEKTHQPASLHAESYAPQAPYKHRNKCAFSRPFSKDLEKFRPEGTPHMHLRHSSTEFPHALPFVKKTVLLGWRTPRGREYHNLLHTPHFTPKGHL